MRDNGASVFVRHGVRGDLKQHLAQSQVTHYDSLATVAGVVPFSRVELTPLQALLAVIRLTGQVDFARLGVLFDDRSDEDV